MPELQLKKIRFPELHLPEMSRDDISKALGDARKELGEVRKDLNDFRREMEMPRVDLSKVEVPKIDLSKVEVPKEARDAARKAGKNMTKAAQDAGLVKRPASRLPRVIAAVVTLGLVGWALANSPTVRARLRAAAQQIQDKMAERNNAWDLDEEAHAFDASSAPPVEPSAFADAISTPDSPFAEPPSDVPDGFGKTNGTHTIDSDEPARA
jgi:hypothetical protein